MSQPCTRLMWGRDPHVGDQSYLIPLYIEPRWYSQLATRFVFCLPECYSRHSKRALSVPPRLQMLLLVVLGFFSALLPASAQDTLLHLKAGDPLLHFTDGWHVSTASEVVESFLFTESSGLALKVELPGQYTAV